MTRIQGGGAARNGSVLFVRWREDCERQRRSRVIFTDPIERRKGLSREERGTPTGLRTLEEFWRATPTESERRQTT